MLVSALTLVVAASPFTLGAPVQVAPVGVSPSIDCSPTECVVAWIQYDHGPEQDACIRIATFSAQKPTPVVSLLTCEGGSPSVAASPSATLVSWSTGKHLMGTAITNGRPGPIFKISVEQRADSVDAAFDGQRFVLVWSTSKQVSMLRLSPQAQLFDEKPVVLATGRDVSTSSVGCAARKCLVTHVERPMNENQRLSAVVLEKGVPAPTPIATRALEGIVTTSANALVALSTESSQLVRTVHSLPSSAPPECVTSRRLRSQNARWWAGSSRRADPKASS